ncbi:MAG: PilZ domain-containing protein [Sphingomicrobium sp.]
MRRSAALSYRVRVFDASPLGCRLELIERPQLEERVWIKFDRDPIEGMVCWTEGSCVGIEFAWPMH